jgi:hypothetical protein
VHLGKPESRLLVRASACVLSRLDHSSAHWFSEKEDATLFSSLAAAVVTAWQLVLRDAADQPQLTQTQVKPRLTVAHHHVVSQVLARLGFATLFPYDHHEDVFWPSFRSIFETPLAAMLEGK